MLLAASYYLEPTPIFLVDTVMASLLTIPLELLVAVSTHLSTPDLASLRLTCNQVERSLYKWFSQEFFTKKQFMLTHPSLQTLVDISKHAGFSKRLKHVIIATNIYDVIPRRFRDEEAAIQYRRGQHSQKRLNTGLGRDMLIEAFKNLPNLHTVGIRDFNAPSRVRDGNNASWTSWGATTVLNETGMHLSFSDRVAYDCDDHLSRIFYIVSDALGTAGRFPPELEVLLRRDGLPDSALDLPEYVLPILEPVLMNFTSLLLSINLSITPIDTNDTGIALDTPAGRSLREFLNYTPNLSRLRLNFRKSVVKNNAQFLDWLSLPVPGFTKRSTNYMSPPPVSLSLLQKLELGQLKVLPDTLLAIFAKFAPSLRSISLWRMALYSQAAPPHGHKPNFWAQLFRDMAQIPHLDLAHIKVGLLQQDHAFSTSMYVNFTGEESSDGPGLKQVEHSGPDTAKFLDALIERVKVEWIEQVMISIGGEDSEVSMYGEDDDEEDEEDE